MPNLYGNIIRINAKIFVTTDNGVILLKTNNKKLYHSPGHFILFANSRYDFSVISFLAFSDRT